MWNIELTDRNDSLETLNFHSSFTSLNKTLSYKLSPSGNRADNIEINFITKKDKDKKEVFIEASGLVDKKMTIIYYNPGIGVSGLIEPLIILENEDSFFKVMFNTTLLNNSETYLLSIEFFIQKK